MTTLFKTTIPLSVRYQELCCVKRLVANWMHYRKQQSYIARVSDRYFDRETLRPKRVEVRYPDMQEDRQTLATRLYEARCRAKKKHVVFFGDGDFNSSIKKHNSLAKKRLLKVMATRGLVFLLDEYRTSKMCPCGHDELITRDDTSSTRLRRHKTGDTACPLPHQIGDRDELACVNMLHCALKAIHGGQRPSFLCRPCDS